MGIIREIFIVFLFIFSVNLSAKTPYDTIYFSENQYVEHFVKGGESLKKIAKLHNVTTADIKIANDLDKRLFYNQLLYIPIYLNNVDEKAVVVSDLVSDENIIDSSVTNIALLMPYYLIKNDTMFNDYEDKSGIPNIYYKKSEEALSFHIGIELAIDSLRKTGKKIVLHIFDTNKDTLEVKKLVNSNKLNNMDVIIGPMYSKLFQILCKKHGRDASKVLISPLSRSNKGIKQYTSVYQIAPTYKKQSEILSDYLIKNKSEEKIIILHDPKNKGLAAYIKHRFNASDRYVPSYQITNTKVDSIRGYFTEKQCVLLLSSNKAFINKIFASIGSIDSVSTVFAFESVKSYDNLDITNLMELDVHIPNSRSIDYSNSFDRNFLALFEKEYSTNVRKYTKVAYDLLMHFCSNSRVYEFEKIKNGYHENNKAPIYHYADYELIPVM